MEASDFEPALSDLEKRVDRLRALYEQFFRGYERIEPTVPRKDVERRLYALRKEMPRNTGLRFRFQQLQQRYTMFTTRWGRQTRMIEEGTHPLVLERLKRRRNKVKDTSTLERPGEEEGDAPSSYELNLDEEMNLDELLSEAELSAVAAAIDKPGPHRGPAVPAGTGPSQRPSAPPPPMPAAAADEGYDSSKTAKFEPIRLPGEAAKPIAAKPAPAAAAVSSRAGAPTSATDSAAGARRPSAPGGQPRSFGKPTEKPRRAPTSASRSFGRPKGMGDAPSTGSRPRPAAPSSGSGGSMDDARKRAIYEDFVAARKRNNESGAVKYDAVARRIEQMLPELQKKHAGKKVDFEVVVRNGRVGLKPKTRTGG